MIGKPTCTKYTLKTKSCDIIYHFKPQIVAKERKPPEYASSKINSVFIIKNLEIYICKEQKNIFIGTGKF